MTAASARTLCLIAASLTALPAAFAESAAEIDWQPLVRCEQGACAGDPTCHGAYVEPVWLTEIDSEDPDRIDADADSGQQQPNGDFVLTGDVLIRQGARHIRAGRAILNQEQDALRLEEGVMIRQPGLLMTGTRGVATITTKQASLEGASFVIHDNRLRGDAASLDYTAENTVVIKRGSLTRCEPDNASWRLAGSAIELDREEGFGTARNLTLRVRDIPVVYLPYLKFPIDDRRRSGFLMPALGFDSEGGTDLALPYYINLAPNYDATYTPRVIARRGLINEGQLRLLTGRSSNEINAAFLYRDRLYDDRTTIDMTGATAAYTEPFTRRDRWALNVRHSGGWARRWQTTLRYSALSDAEYLHDIGAEVDTVAKEQFYSGIDQSVANRRSVALDRIAEVTYRGDHWLWRLGLQGYQSFLGEEFEPYERLPRMQIAYARYRGGLQYEVESEFVHFSRDDGHLAPEEQVTGSRLAVDAAIAYPIHWTWGYLTPTLAARHRRYDLDEVLPGPDSSPSLTVPSFSLDTGIIFERRSAGGADALVQTIEPRLFYLYTREEEQSTLPNFDTDHLTRTYQQLFRTNRFAGKDRIADARRLSVGITGRVLDGKRGGERLRASLGQIYYFDDRQVLLTPSPPAVDFTANYSALYSELRWSPGGRWHFEGALEWDPRTDETGRSHATLQYRPDAHRIINLNYHFTDSDRHVLPLNETVEESDLSFVWPVGTHWSLVGRWNFDWDRDQTIESLAGAEYRNCCWRSRLVVRRYLKEPRTVVVLQEDPANPGTIISDTRLDRRAASGIFFEFQLRGLATLGRKLNALLGDGITGYEEREEAIDF